MPLLALVLALAAPPPASLKPLPFVERRFAPPCPDIDPGLVRYVAPPSGAGPVWPVTAPRPEAKAVKPATSSAPACPRLMGADGP